jgi:hypothetical protein
MHVVFQCLHISRPFFLLVSFFLFSVIPGTSAADDGVFLDGAGLYFGGGVLRAYGSLFSCLPLLSPPVVADVLWGSARSGEIVMVSMPECPPSIRRALPASRIPSTYRPNWIGTGESGVPLGPTLSVWRQGIGSVRLAFRLRALRESEGKALAF